MPTTMPPIIPAINPENSGAPLARAMPKQRGRATKNTTMLAGRSLFKEFNIAVLSRESNVEYL
jgi:hypothetical protein